MTEHRHEYTASCEHHDELCERIERLEMLAGMNAMVDLEVLDKVDEIEDDVDDIKDDVDDIKDDVGDIKDDDDDEVVEVETTKDDDNDDDDEVVEVETTKDDDKDDDEKEKESAPAPSSNDRFRH